MLCEVHFTTPPGQEVEISWHFPTQFVAENLENILPDWDSPHLQIILVLQQSRFPLDTSNAEIVAEKDCLRERFLDFAKASISLLQKAGFSGDYIDPKTGYSGHSTPGSMIHDDTAVIAALRGFRVTRNDCFVLHHPVWDTNIYPSILMIGADVESAIPILVEAASKQGWTLTNC
ncbi:MAG: methylmalonic aciduria and homocystinuria type D protein [Jaaginema sp. PMC 1079.18]|nr:methylmalonic aciduria and homocystinuria type D protein [Jaaginema sp. PMC 1080.18]MEC4852173.1 methylmalonic aciduria and homocystinuria type D protein [Jaaginema sp. PMC 1079.18]MEC4864922.1 methylmalonic aciduria and homocystinuria type D protein [Jaaginema sp. PMC 1078.18]